MTATKGYAVLAQGEAIQPFSFVRNKAGEQDITIEILYCGVCHYDIHQARNEYGNTHYPFVPGHEIVGRVVKTGSGVTRFKTGDLAGVGYFIDSCGHCHPCRSGLEQHCEVGITPTQNGIDKLGNPTFGGYSNNIIAHENYAVKIPETLSLPGVAPLLCAGITAYSALRQWGVRQGHEVAVLGLGGIGHLAVKLAASMGAKVTVLSGSSSKKADAGSLGASGFILTSDTEQLKAAASRFDFIIDTAAAKHDYNLYLQLLKFEGTMILLGVPPEASELMAYQLISGRRRITGSFIGGVKETQEMINYCAANGITADVEVITPDKIEEAFDRTVSGAVKYRFVLDMQATRNDSRE